MVIPVHMRPIPGFRECVFLGAPCSRAGVKRLMQAPECLVVHFQEEVMILLHRNNLHINNLEPVPFSGDFQI